MAVRSDEAELARLRHYDTLHGFSTFFKGKYSLGILPEEIRHPDRLERFIASRVDGAKVEVVPHLKRKHLTVPLHQRQSAG